MVSVDRDELLHGLGSSVLSDPLDHGSLMIMAGLSL